MLGYPLHAKRTRGYILEKPLSEIIGDSALAGLKSGQTPGHLYLPVASAQSAGRQTPTRCVIPAFQKAEDALP